MIKLKHLVAEHTILNEVSISGKTLINVDIQPEYEGAFSFRTDRWTDFLNNNYANVNRLVFLYNGRDTLGMISEPDYKMWLVENGVSEEVIDGSQFYDKGYAFFRYCMDKYLDDEVIANFVRFMYQNSVRDSRDMDRSMWAKYLREYRRTDRREIYTLLKHSDDCVHIPDLMDYIKNLNNIVVTGGGVDECLKEVEIALKALNKPYDVLNQFTY